MPMLKSNPAHFKTKQLIVYVYMAFKWKFYTILYETQNNYNNVTVT